MNKLMINMVVWEDFDRRNLANFEVDIDDEIVRL